jgi:ABC-2 type transport system ATP-binding protein
VVALHPRRLAGDHEAFRCRVVLHQLATRTASLEEAFFEATGATEEYVGRLLTGEPNAGGMQ